MTEGFYEDISVFGVAVLKQYVKFENGKMVTYGYSIRLDKDGKEVSRSEPKKLTSICWGDGFLFTEEDLYNIKHKVPRRNKMFTWRGLGSIIAVIVLVCVVMHRV